MHVRFPLFRGYNEFRLHMFPGAKPVTAVSWVPEMGATGDEVMTCMQLDQAGRPLHLVERPRPQPSASDLLIEVRACGVCRTDLHIVDGDIHGPLSDRSRPRDRWARDRARTPMPKGSL